MARRKLTVIEQAIKDAAAELGLPKDHWDVERLGSLPGRLNAGRRKWAQGQSSPAAADTVTLMDDITKLRTAAGLTGPREFNIRFVHRYVGIADIVCPHCKKNSR